MGIGRFFRKIFGSKNSKKTPTGGSKENDQNDEIKNKRLNGTSGSPAGTTTPLKGVATKSATTTKQPQSAKLKASTINKSPSVVGVSE
ncbi:hypothetical protein M5D96_004401, partial [Drosophila gunungcola]